MMGVSRVGAKLSRVSSLLDLERDALRSGALDRLDGLVEEREQLVENLRGTIEPGDQDAIAALQEIKTKALRNAGLMAAALDGIRSASRQIAEIDAAHNQLSTYGSDGTVADVLGGERRMEKRA